jgi:hypothetical protein
MTARLLLSRRAAVHLAYRQYTPAIIIIKKHRNRGIFAAGLLRLNHLTPSLFRYLFHSHSPTPHPAFPHPPTPPSTFHSAFFSPSFFSFFFFTPDVLPPHSRLLTLPRSALRLLSSPTCRRYLTLSFSLPLTLAFIFPSHLISSRRFLKTPVNIKSCIIKEVCATITKSFVPPVATGE